MIVYRTPLSAVAVSRAGWVPFGDGLEITPAPLVTVGDGHPHFARLTYRDAVDFAASIGARLLTQAEHDELARIGRKLRPIIKTPGPLMASLEYALQHDAELLDQIEHWDQRTPLVNAGKQWVHGAAPGRALNYGWWDSSAPNGRMWQTLGTRHDDGHTDYSQLTMLVRPITNRDSKPDNAGATSTMTPRPTLRRGASGEHVAALQRLLGVTPDGAFGPATEAAVRRRQVELGLVADGVVGPKTWTALGEKPAAPAPAPSGRDPRAPACVAALRDANASWPSRRRASDGIMGDAAHQARPSDHNLGNAVDITHDPAAGCDGDVLSRLAIQDSRVSYVIWNREIWSRARAAEGWRRYTGSNPHTHHCHISVRVEAREDASAWPWAPPDEAA